MFIFFREATAPGNIGNATECLREAANLLVEFSKRHSYDPDKRSQNEKKETKT